MRGVSGVELEMLRDARLGQSSQWWYSDEDAGTADELVARGLLSRVYLEGEYYDTLTKLGEVVLAASLGSKL